ncbi:MAG: TonB-dependent receptor [Pirellulaceae bacterium]|nr:TonB-dependent receptor [Pirellulaceae bacterium]
MECNRHARASLIWLATVGSLFAQPPVPPEGTLPPVEVRPAEPTIAIEPPPADGPIDFGTELSFPSLSEQVLGGSTLDPGGLNSAFRGEKSLFDQSNLSTIVDSQLLREKMSADMFRAIQYEVGVLVQATGRGQASVFLHGVTGQQVLVLVDGIRMNNTVLRAGPNQYFNTVDPGQVERIEVIRGAGSVLYGSDAIGGVINIVTRGADPYRADYSAGSFRQYLSSADSASYSRANIEGWVGDSGLFAGGSYMNVNDVDIGGGLGRQPATNYRQNAGDIKYNRLIGDNQMLTFAFQHFEQQDLPRSDRFAPFVFNRPGNTLRPTFFDPQQRDLAYIRWQGITDGDNPLYDVFSLTTSYSLTKEGTTELRSPTRTDVGEFENHVFGFTMALARNMTDQGLGVFTYGADYYYEDIDAFRTTDNPTNAAPPVPIAPQYPDDSLADRAGVFAQWDVTLTQRLNAVVGVRYENSNLSGTPIFTVGGVPTATFFDRTYQDWVASCGLTYSVTDQINLVGGYYEGYRAPTTDDLTANNTFLQNNQQSPVLEALAVQPEQSRTYEIGAKYNGDRLRLQIMEWWLFIDDFITRVPQATNPNNFLLGNRDAYLNGTELAGEYLLDCNYSLYGNFAYTFGRQDNNDFTGQVPVSRIPPTQGVIGARWRASDLRTYVDAYTWLVNRQDRYNPVNLTDSRFYVNRDAATPGFGTLNLRCGTTFGECGNHRLSLNLENITDKFYRVLGSGVDGTGFNALLGYEFVQ